MHDLSLAIKPATTTATTTTITIIIIIIIMWNMRCRRTEKMRNMMVTVIPVVVGALGTVAKHRVKQLLWWILKIVMIMIKHLQVDQISA